MWEFRVNIKDAVAEPLPGKLEVVYNDQRARSRGLEKAQGGTICLAMSGFMKT